MVRCGIVKAVPCGFVQNMRQNNELWDGSLGPFSVIGLSAGLKEQSNPRSLWGGRTSILPPFLLILWYSKTNKVTIKSMVKSKSTPKKKPLPTKKKSAGKLVGIISHYFSNIAVCVIKVSAPFKEGDEIRIMGGESTDFNQKVKSMQVDYKPVKVAKKGNSVGLKISEKVREGYKVYRVL
jgi:hypothetical protein